MSSVPLVCIVLWCLLLSSCAPLTLAFAKSSANSKNPISLRCTKKYANYSGEILLGAMFPMHNLILKKRQPSDKPDHVCGEINTEDGLQQLEAMMFALDEINSKKDLLRFRLGAIAVDTCQDPDYALNQALDFIQVLVGKRQGQSDYLCENGSKPTPQGFLSDLQNIVGIVGADGSDVSIAIANFLKIFEMPQVSYGSTTAELSNAERYPYFLRTVPNDQHAIVVIATLLARYDWTFVTVIHDDTSYGLNSVSAFDNLVEYKKVENKTICVHKKFRVDSLEQNTNNQTKYSTVVAELNRIRTSNNCSEVRMHEAGNEIIEHFLWIGTDSWAGRKLAEATNNSKILSRSVTVMPEGYIVNDFNNYLIELRPSELNRNPWLEEMVESYCKCVFRHGISNQKGCKPTNTSGILSCEEIERACVKRIFSVAGFKQMKNVHFVMEAVYVFAYALKKIQDVRCSDVLSDVECTYRVSQVHGSDLLGAMKKIVITDRKGRPFTFRNEIDGPPRYSIFTYNMNSKDWHLEGEANTEDSNFLIMNSSFTNFTKRFPPSKCSKDCAMNEAKSIPPTAHGVCCWSCSACAADQFIVKVPRMQRNKSNSNAEYPERFPDDDDEFISSKCQNCEPGTHPSADKKYCIAFTVTSMSLNNSVAIMVLALSSLGLLMTLGVTIIFAKFLFTPIFKASGRESSIMLIIGIASHFLAAIGLQTTPTKFTCLLASVAPGLCGTISYAAIFAKTSRVARIFHVMQNPNSRKSRFNSPLSQVSIMLTLVLVEIVVLIVMVIVSKPDATENKEAKRTLLLCSDKGQFPMMAGMVCPLILLALSTLFAFRIRKTPVGYNESRSLLFINYVTCLVYAAGVTMTIAFQDNIYCMLPMSLLLVISAFTQLVGLFGHKVYLVLRRPHKNSKDSVMTRQRASSMNSVHHQIASPSMNSVHSASRPGGPNDFLKPSPINFNRMSSETGQDSSIPSKYELELTESSSPNEYSATLGGGKKSVSFDGLNNDNEADNASVRRRAESQEFPIDGKEKTGNDATSAQSSTAQSTVTTATTLGAYKDVSEEDSGSSATPTTHITGPSWVHNSFQKEERNVEDSDDGMIDA